ncbi:MAG: nucleotide-binding universal stress UspA family protein, partial [Bacteroidia bacterium]
MSNQDKLGSILVPVDFSEQSEVALEQAVSLSRVFNSEIHVLNVINEDFSLSQLFDDNDKIQYQKRAEARLDEFVKVKNAEFGIELKSMQVTGKIYNQIVNSADVIDAEFIVMGTAGSTTLKKR